MALPLCHRKQGLKNSQLVSEQGGITWSQLRQAYQKICPLDDTKKLIKLLKENDIKLNTRIRAPGNEGASAMKPADYAYALLSNWHDDILRDVHKEQYKKVQKHKDQVYKDVKEKKKIPPKLRKQDSGNSDTSIGSIGDLSNFGSDISSSDHDQDLKIDVDDNAFQNIQHQVWQNGNPQINQHWNRWQQQTEPVVDYRM